MRRDCPRQLIYFMAFYACIFNGPSLLASHRYEIQAALDTEKGEIRGVVKLTFFNETPAAMDAVPIMIADGRITRVTSDSNKELRLEPGTGGASIRVFLDSALPPGRSTQLQITFAGNYSFAPSGSGYRLAVGAWHPKALVFREGEFRATERQADSYDVILTVPSVEVVVSSGTLLSEKPRADKTKELRYRAENIAEFGLASSPRFLETIREGDGVTIRSCYFEGGEKWGVKLADYAARIIPFYQKTFGFYPQRILTILPGSKTSFGGYPAASNIIVVHDTLDKSGDIHAEWITSHEIGHQYWGWDCVIDSGQYYHWPGLALGIYTDRLYNEAFNSKGTENHRRFIETYLGGVDRKYDTTLLRTRDQIEALSFDFNNIVAHGKSYAALQMLEELIGKDKFFGLAQTLLKRFRNSYLSPQAFQAAAEEIHGQTLDWFFSDWVNSNKVLSYAVESLEQTGSAVKVQVKRTESAGMPLDLELLLDDGTKLRQKISREPEVQTLAFDVQGKAVQARLDPDRRMALYSPEGRHVWGRKVRVLELRIPEHPAWGTNILVATIQNEDIRPHEIEIHVQSNNMSLPRGWGFQIKYKIAGGEKKTIEHPFILPAFPGKARMRVRARDATEDLQCYRHEDFVEFPFANPSTVPLKLTPDLRQFMGVGKDVYPRLVMSEQGHFIFYFLEGDSFVEKMIGEIWRRREQAYRELAAKINPAFQEKVAFYLFPDADSKLAYFSHRGLGWAPGGNILVEIFNEKERVDPNHELVHIMAGSLGDPPALFSEGLAVYFQEGEKWDDFPFNAWAKAFYENGMLWPLSQIFTFTEIGSQESKPLIAYPQAASIVHYLAGRYGFDKLMQAYKELKSGRKKEITESNEARFLQIFGLSLADLEKDWLINLENTPMVPVPKARIEEVKAKDK